jgi:hypothetical protein
MRSSFLGGSPMWRDLQTMSILLCIALAGASDASPAGDAPFEVGQRWVYRHIGPKPGSFEPDAIDGERIAQVIRNDPNNGLWIIEERYTKDDEAIGRFRVDPNRMLIAIEIEGKEGKPALLRYDPPIPYEAPELAVGQTATIESTLRMDSPSFAVPTTLEIERLADETVETDAGTFEACRHYKTTTHSTLDIKIGKIPVTECRYRWYHPRVNGLVKETYHKDPVKFLSWSRAGYDASSILTAFGVQPVSEPPASAVAAEPPSSHGAHAGPGVALLVGLIVVTATAALCVARRRTTHPHPKNSANDI